MDIKKKFTFQRPQNYVYCINSQMFKPARGEWIELTTVEYYIKLKKTRNFKGKFSSQRLSLSVSTEIILSKLN